ncbi:hypothetical protein GCM10027075_77350 [Streptomyces heilongjiangensis]
MHEVWPFSPCGWTGRRSAMQGCGASDGTRSKAPEVYVAPGIETGATAGAAVTLLAPTENGSGDRCYRGFGTSFTFSGWEEAR